MAVGENSLDLLAVVDEWPAPDSKAALRDFRLLPGGQVATAAVATARLGARTRYCGVVGDDVWGVRLRDALSPELDATLVVRAGARTRTAVVLVDRKGRRTVLEDRDPSLILHAADIPGGWVESGRVLMMDGTQPEAARSAARRARAAGLPVVLDVEEAGEIADELMQVTDIAIVPQAFAAAQAGRANLGEALARLEERYQLALVVATLGPDGALARCDGREFHVPAWRTEVVDTTGAGDAFRGGFVAAWIELGSEAPVEVLLERAARVAAWNCRALGAQTALPKRWDPA